MVGSGLMCERAGRWELVGIFYGRSGCSTGARPKVYDDMNTATVNFMKKTITEADRRT